MSLDVKDYPLVAHLEEVAWRELDRQYLNGEIDPGTMESAYLDTVGGEIQGRPDLSKVIVKVIEAYRRNEHQTGR